MIIASPRVRARESRETRGGGEGKTQLCKTLSNARRVWVCGCVCECEPASRSQPLHCIPATPVPQVSVTLELEHTSRGSYIKARPPNPGGLVSSLSRLFCIPPIPLSFFVFISAPLFERMCVCPSLCLCLLPCLVSPSSSLGSECLAFSSSGRPGCRQHLSLSRHQNGRYEDMILEGRNPRNLCRISCPSTGHHRRL
jgi:hypothetical protein